VTRGERYRKRLQENGEDTSVLGVALCRLVVLVTQSKGGHSVILALTRRKL